MRGPADVHSRDAATLCPPRRRDGEEPNLMQLPDLTLRPQTRSGAPASAPPAVDRIPGVLLIGVIVGSLVLSGLTANRIASVERGYKPAVDASRKLVRTLEATRALLTDDRLGSVESRISRADRQA